MGKRLLSDFKVGDIITSADVNLTSWRAMEKLAITAGLYRDWNWGEYSGRVDIEFGDLKYRTTCRYGELRFKRIK